MARSSTVPVWWVGVMFISSILFFVPFIYLVATIPHLIAICNSLFAFVVLSLVAFFLILALWVGIMIRDMNQYKRGAKKKDSSEAVAVQDGLLNAEYQQQRNFEELSGDEEDQEEDDEQSLIGQHQQGNNELVLEESNRAANLIEETRRNQQYKQTTEYIVLFLRVGSFLIYIVLLIGLLLFSVWIGTTKSRAEGLVRGSMSINEIVTRANSGEAIYKEAQPYIQKFLEQLGQSTVSVERDSNDVIHITAPNEYTLYFTQGFVHAQERLWQIDTLRSTIKGELSSLFGYGLIFSDQYYITMGLYEAAQRDYIGLSDELKQRLEAYAYGLNTYSKLLPGLPVEFQLLSYKPGIFTGVDILAHHKYISLTLAGNIHSEIARYGLELVGLSNERINTILPYSYPSGFPIISSPSVNLNTNITYQSRPSEIRSTSTNSSTRKKSLTASIAVLAEQIMSGLEDLADIFSSSSTIRQRFALSMFDPQNHFSSPEQKNAFLQASNNWVISGKFTSTGKPFHANDIHLHFQGPNIFLLMHLKIVNSNKPMEVIGASISGLPCIIVGRNGHGVSWSITNSGADTMDTYLIDDNADGLTYNYNGKKSYTTKTVTLSVKGGAKATFNVTKAGEFGPLVDQLYIIPNLPKQKRLALRYLDVLLKNDKSTQTFFDLPYATNYDDFVKAFKHLNAPVLNVLYADNDNRIGYIMAGKLPKRVSADNLGIRPVKTNDDREKLYTWETETSGDYKTNDFDNLPDIAPEMAIDPGFIFSANNKAEGAPVVTITNDYGLLYGRSMRIQSLISSLVSRKNVSMSDMVKVQTDSISVLYFMNRNIFQRMKPFTDKYKEGIRNDLANNWDGDMKPDSKHATIFEYWMTYLTNLAANETRQLNELPFSTKKSFPLSLRYALSAIQTELSTGATDPNCKLFSSDKTCLGYAKDQLEAVLVALRSKFSFVPLYSSYRIHQTKFTHPIFGAYGLTGCLGTRIARRSGGTDTINEGGPSDANLSNNFGPTYRQIIDHANPENSVFIMPMGQSGNIFSSAYDNYLRAWEEGKYIPMKTKDYTLRDVLKISK